MQDDDMNKKQFYCGNCKAMYYCTLLEFGECPACRHFGNLHEINTEKLFPTNVEIINIISQLTVKLSYANAEKENLERKIQALNGSLNQSSKSLKEVIEFKKESANQQNILQQKIDVLERQLKEKESTKVIAEPKIGPEN